MNDGMRWRASMPRGMPKAGMVTTVFAVKTSSGARLEHEGDISVADAERIWAILIPPPDVSVGAQDEATPK